MNQNKELARQILFIRFCYQRLKLY